MKKKDVKKSGYRSDGTRAVYTRDGTALALRPADPARARLVDYLDELMQRYQRDAARLRDALAELQEALDGGARSFVHCLEWSDGLQMAAARAAVYEQVIQAAWLREGIADPFALTMEHIREELLAQVQRGARYAGQSTSPMTNVMKRYELQAWAELLTDFPQEGAR